MHKTDIVVALANNTDLGVNKADLVVSAFIEQITNALARGESVALLGFGTFNVSERAAREGRNPQTGATIQIAASKTVTFKAGKALKDAVNPFPWRHDHAALTRSPNNNFSGTCHVINQ
jgi:DNA-binding protein HU-beta/DNA-binding protein HU-alpha